MDKLLSSYKQHNANMEKHSCITPQHSKTVMQYYVSSKVDKVFIPGTEEIEERSQREHHGLVPELESWPYRGLGGALLPPHTLFHRVAWDYWGMKYCSGHGYGSSVDKTPHGARPECNTQHTGDSPETLLIPPRNGSKPLGSPMLPWVHLTILTVFHWDPVALGPLGGGTSLWVVERAWQFVAQWSIQVWELNSA